MYESVKQTYRHRSWCTGRCYVWYTED